MGVGMEDESLARLTRYNSADEAQNAELEARMSALVWPRGDIANLDEWEKRAREAVEWGIVYENPEAIVALASEVKRLRGMIALAKAMLDDSTCRKSVLNMVVNLRVALDD
jgi:hypothetical protein